MVRIELINPRNLHTEKFMYVENYKLAEERVHLLNDKLNTDGNIIGKYWTITTISR